MEAHQNKIRGNDIRVAQMVRLLHYAESGVRAGVGLTEVVKDFLGQDENI